MKVRCTILAPTIVVVAIIATASVALAQDGCGRDPDRFEEVRRGMAPLKNGGDSVWYESIAQTGVYGTGKEYIYCLENHSSRYHVEFQWGEDSAPRKYCYAMVKRARHSGCLTPDSRLADLQSKTLEFRRLNYGNWTRVRPETVVPRSASIEQFVAPVEVANYSEAQRSAFFSEDGFQLARLEDFLASPERGHLLGKDGNLNLSALIRDEDNLLQYLKTVGPVRIASRMYTAIPARQRTLAELNDEERDHNTDDLITVEVGVSSSIERVESDSWWKSDTLVATTEVYYRVAEPDESRRYLIGKYPRFIYMIGTEGPENRVLGTVSLEPDPGSVAVSRNTATGKGFRIASANAVVSDSSYAINRASDPSVQGSMAISIFRAQ